MIRARLSYANVTASIALFVALGGGAYAATVLPARSVGSRELKKDAVLTSRIKRGAVDGSKVRDGSLTGDDVKESTLGVVPTATNAVHAASAVALDKMTYKAVTGNVGANSLNGATAQCDPGQHVIGGGVKVGDALNSYVIDDYPEGNAGFTGRVGSAVASTFTVYAICTSVTTTG
jgi:hypothetical protein